MQTHTLREIWLSCERVLRNEIHYSITVYWNMDREFPEADLIADEMGPIQQQFPLVLESLLLLNLFVYRSKVKD